MSEESYIAVENKYKLSNQVEDFLYLKILQILDENTSLKKIGFINLTEFKSALPLNDFTKKNNTEVIKHEVNLHDIFSFPKGVPTIEPLNLSYKKLLDLFKTLDLIFLQYPIGVRGLDSLQFEFIKDNLKEDSLVILLNTDQIIKKFSKNYLDSNLFLLKVINLHQCYSPVTSISIKAFILSKKKEKYVQLIETSEVISNYNMEDVHVGNIKDVIKDEQDRDLSKTYFSIPNQVTKVFNKIENKNKDIIFNNKDEYKEYLGAVEFDLQKEKIITIKGENYLGFDQSFAVYELETLLKKENIELIQLSKIQKGHGKISLRKQNKKKNEYRNTIKEFKNTIYVPTWPSKKTKVEHDWAKLKDWDYYYFNLNTDTYDAKYIASFLNSDIGRLQFEYLAFGQFIKQLTSQSVNKLKIPIKNLYEQKISVNTQAEIQILKNNLEKLEKDSVHKPKTIDADTLFEDIPDYTTQKLVTAEESGIHEYKSTLKYDLNSKKVERYLTDNCLKTITAFLNTKGGNLIIGVDDKKNILGIEIDNFRTQDDYFKFLKDRIKTRIGVVFLEKDIQINFLKYEGKTICQVKCNKIPESETAYFDNQVYVRSGPSSEKLEGKDLIEWNNKRN